MYHKLKVSILTCSIIILIILGVMIFKNYEKSYFQPTLALKSNFASNPTSTLDTGNIPSIVARLPQLPITENQFAEIFQYFTDPNLFKFPYFINDEKYINQINLLKNDFLKYFNNYGKIIEQYQKNVDNSQNQLNYLQLQKKNNEIKKNQLKQQVDAIRKNLNKNNNNNKTELNNRINEIETEIITIEHHNKIQDISIDTLQSNYNNDKNEYDNALKVKNDLLVTAELQLKSIFEIKNIINQNKNYSEPTRL